MLVNVHPKMGRRTQKEGNSDHSPPNTTLSSWVSFFNQLAQKV